MAAVLLAHGAAFWLAARRAPQIEARAFADDGRAVDIQLEPPLIHPPGAPKAARPVRPGRTAAPPAAIERQEPDVAPRLPPPADASDPDPAARDDRARRALGRVLRCNAPDAHDLSREQRIDCFLRARPAAPLPFALDPKEQAEFDADARREPFLARTPINNCQPRAGDRGPSAFALGSAAGGRGMSMAARTTGGIVCAHSF